jgi:hypothetical protein
MPWARRPPAQNRCDRCHGRLTIKARLGQKLSADSRLFRSSRDPAKLDQAFEALTPCSRSSLSPICPAPDP